eukprot:COSAG01_NODE_5034_length_4534_cov_1.968433_2_plen_259_part_00
MAPDTSFQWRVRYWLASGNATAAPSAWSAPYAFHTAPSAQTWLNASWIDGSRGALRRRVILPAGATVREAFVFASSIGFHHVLVDGVLLGNQSTYLFEPGQSVYSERALFTSYNITGAILRCSTPMQSFCADGVKFLGFPVLVRSRAARKGWREFLELVIVIVFHGRGSTRCVIRQMQRSTRPQPALPAPRVEIRAFDGPRCREQATARAVPAGAQARARRRANRRIGRGSARHTFRTRRATRRAASAVRRTVEHFGL